MPCSCILESHSEPVVRQRRAEACCDRMSRLFAQELAVAAVGHFLDFPLLQWKGTLCQHASYMAWTGQAVSARERVVKVVQQPTQMPSISVPSRRKASRGLRQVPCMVCQLDMQDIEYNHELTFDGDRERSSTVSEHSILAKVETTVRSD